MSSTCPTIIVDKGSGDVKMVSGGAGGTKITSQTALVCYYLREKLTLFDILSSKVILRNLWLGRNLQEATDDTRLHHQLAPMTLFHEPGWSQVVVLLLYLEIDFF